MARRNFGGRTLEGLGARTLEQYAKDPEGLGKIESAGLGYYGPQSEVPDELKLDSDIKEMVEEGNITEKYKEEEKKLTNEELKKINENYVNEILAALDTAIASCPDIFQPEDVAPKVITPQLQSDIEKQRNEFRIAELSLEESREK